VIEDTERIFTADKRITEGMGKCDAKQVNFKKGSSYSFLFDLAAPYMIEFKNLVNTYGVSNNIDGSDTLNMYIYSDYLRDSVKVPQFFVEDN
jgi:hypothetical protein